MKVLHVINSLNVGGAEVLLSNTLQGNGLSPQVNNTLAYFIGVSPLLDKIDQGVKKVDLQYSGGADLLFLLRRLRRLIKEEKPDIIHTHLNPAGSYVNMVKPKSIPQIHTLHTMYTQDQETRPFLKAVEKRTLFRDDRAALIFLSPMLEKDFSSAISFKGKKYILPNFIEDSFFEIKPATPVPEQLRVVAVGTIREVKNYQYLLDIFARLKGLPVSLDIYGGGDTTAFNQRIEKEQLNVRMMGQTTDVSSVLGKYDLFIMASKFEGYPLSVIEAMAANLPVLLSDIPALKDIAGEHADYFRLDDPSDAAGVLKEYLTASDRYRSRIEKARAYAGDVARKRTYIQKLIDIYRETISGYHLPNH